LPRPLLNGAGEFSFAAVSESEIYDAVISIRSDAAGIDTFVIRKIAFASSSSCANPCFRKFGFLGWWKTSVVLS
jgi:hypothetical protein